jgi:putative ABC transport system permease protein
MTALALRIERWLYALRARLRAIVDRQEVADEIDEELRYHIDSEITRRTNDGIDPAAARTAALRQFGGVQQRSEEIRDAHGLNLWESLRQDLRYAVRTARRSRAFAVGAVAILALGIGANTAVFSVVNAILIEPLPYPDADRIVQIVSTSPSGMSTLASLPRFAMWRDETNVFSQIAAWQSGGPGINLNADDRPEHLKSMNVSREYFSLFGASVLGGRTFGVDEDRPEGPRVAVLSHGLWQRRFGGDPAILGRMILLGGESYEVIGVISPRFKPEPPVDIWLPLRADPFSRDHSSFVQVAARLRPGVWLDGARTQIAQTIVAFRQKYPLAVGPRERFAVLPLRDVVVGDVKPALQLLTAAVVFVLLIACANGASLLLSRANRRRAEIATRAALGARRERLVRQLLSESLVLALAGGVLGLVLGQIGVDVLISWSPAEIPRLTAGVPLDWRVLSFAVTVSGITGILFGLLPAVSASRVDLAAAFKQGGESGTPAGQRRLHAVLVVAEMMLALVLLAGAGLMIKTFLAQRSFDRGFSAENVIAFDMALGSDFERTEQISILTRNAELRLRERGTIAAMAVTRSLPVDPNVVLPFAIVDRALFTGGPYHGVVGVQTVSPDYFNAFRMQIKAGRTFTQLDHAGAPGVAIINESMARRYWQHYEQMDLTEKITIGTGIDSPWEEAPRIVVGVVADVRDPVTGKAPNPLVYVPSDQITDRMTASNNRLFPLTWVIRTKIEPHLVANAIRDELRAVAGGVPVARVRTMTQVLSATTARTDFTMMLFTIFAALALVLAASGMYALMAYSVQQRTQEIGIRLAFGARPSDVRNAVVAQSARMTIVGVGLGTAAAIVLMRLLVTLVFGIETWDPMVFAFVAALLIVVSLAAAYIPALRATRISPLDALRN